MTFIKKTAVHHISTFILFILFVWGCGESTEQRNDDFSSPKILFVDHIHSFTGGVISTGENIRLKLTKGIADSLTGISPGDIFDFSPVLAGITSWEDNKTIVFRPSSNLKNNQKYEAIVNLESIIPGIDKDKREFRFVFHTLVQNYETTIGGLKLYDSKDLTRYKIEGTVQTADIVNFDDLKKILSASQSGKSLDIVWVDSPQNNTFDFTIENVKRSDSAEKVTLIASGSSIDVKKEDNLEIEIPALDDYKVMLVRMITGEENYISVLFSDPLDARQDLTGLVTMSNTYGNFRVVTDLNELKIYSTREIASEVVLKINAAVKNIAGYQLKKQYVTTLEFNQVKPAVRLLHANNKAILPNSDGLTVSFEATGLKAVDVSVVKIFEDNMLQYLQENQLGGQYQLNRVGRPVSKKTVSLNTSGVTNLNIWNRFTLDLEDILTTEPGTFYQIQIGFRKRHSLYFCADNHQIASTEKVLDEWKTEDEDSYWDSYEYYYSSEYNWEERDNPCSHSYYGNRRSVKKMLMASEFGIIAKRSDDGDISVFVTGLLNTEPINGVSIEIYDYQQQLLNSGETDSEGKVQIGLAKKPFVLIAKKGDQTGYLKLDDGSALSLSNFDVTGNKIQKGLKGFIYGERGVWRPADTVHLGFILENTERKLPQNHPVVMELYNPADQLIFRKIKSESVGDIYRFDFVTQHDAPTGNWRATAKVGGASFHKTVKIETIKPNRLKINLTFDKEKFNAGDQTLSGDLNVRWLSGATAKNLKVAYELLLRPVKTTFKEFPNFNFDDLAKEFNSSKKPAYQGRIDSRGYTKVNIDLGVAKNSPGALTAKLFGKVYEEGGAFSISNTSVSYFPYSSFVGIKTPEGDKRGILLTDENHEVRIATVDADGNPINRKGVKVELYKLNWKWWWDNSYEHISNYAGQSYRDPVSKAIINTSNGVGKWKLRINHREWGRYYLKAEDTVSGHSSGQIVYLDWPGWVGKGKRGGLDGVSMLDFSIEKSSYKVGEQIVLSIPSTAGNRILVSLETGSEIIRTFWVVSEKENTSISFEATSDMTPNIYAHLTMIQPHGQRLNDLPIRLYGVKSVKVVDKQTELNPIVKLPAELKPEQQFNIEISERSGRPMAYTVAVVDEGLLNITNYKTPQPWDSFYAREALGVKTWDVYDDVMGAFVGKTNYLLAIGGDDEIEEFKEAIDINRFKPVVKFSGPFYLKKGEKRKHSVQMPQYTGSVKTMVVAAADGAYGSTDVITPVRQPLMVLATLPRVAGPGESMKLPVHVFALEGKTGDVLVKVKTQGTLILSGGKTSKINFSKSGEKTIFFHIKAKQALGVGKVKVTAKSGKFQASYDIEMNVIPRNPVTTDVKGKVISNGERWNYDYQPIGMTAENNACVEISALPPLNIEQRLGYLTGYPHGCIEQITSSVFAELFLDKLITISADKQKEIQRNIEAAIKRLRSFQLSSGGFAYWSGNDYPNNWGSNYAGHFLLEAEKAGYLVPEDMLSDWKGYQSRKADGWGVLSSDDDNDLIQAYRLYSLALAGSPSLGAMNRMKESTSVRREAKWRLALAYATAGYDSQASKLIANLPLEADSALKDFRYSFGSSTRDKAMIMETLLHLFQKEKAFEVLMELANEMSREDKWMSTQTTAYCFIAIAGYVAKFGLDNETNATIHIGGKVKDINTKNFVNQFTISNPDQKTVIAISNNGTAPVFARVIRTGIPLEGSEEAVSRNIKFAVQYTKMDGSPVDVSSLAQGIDFKAQVSVTNPGLKGDYNELALTQIFPSGWEIVNTRLEGSESNNNNVKYTDIRDDRTMHYFDLKPNHTVTFEVLLNAAYQGSYYLPSVNVGAMYDNSIFAGKQGKWVKVVPEN